MNWNQWGPSDLNERRRPVQTTKVPAQRGLVIEDAATGFTGAIIRVEKSGGYHLLVLEGRHNQTRSFPLGPGFLIDGKPVEITPPASRPKSQGPVRTASGSRAASTPQRARTARASRIWVEGVHDAELIEKIWGDDLRNVGVVVEPLHGVDDLAGLIRDFAPSSDRRLSILVDHLVTGSKESIIRDEAMKVPGATDNVLIVGHPYVDIWQAIKPQVLGFDQWPQIPRDTDWKRGILKWLKLPHQTAEDIGLGWKKLLSQVHTYADLEPELLGRVEHMIDFATLEDAR